MGRVMLWLRSALFNLLFYLLTALTALICVPFLALPRRAMVPVLRAYAWTVLVALRLVCNVRLRVTGKELLPRGGAALLAAKHQSALDTVVWLWLVPDCAYVLKQDLLKIPLWGQLAVKSGMIAVDRAAGASAMRVLLKGGKRAAADGRQIVIFPEGTRTAPGEQVPYQPGVAALASALRLPVLPVATDSGRCWGRRTFLKHPGIVTVALLKPLPLGLSRDALLVELRDVIELETARLLSQPCG